MAEDSPQLAALKDQLACAQAARDIALAQLATQQAQKQTQASAVQSQFGNVTGSSLTGEVTVGMGAGNAEASLLAARALEDAAALIATAVQCKIASLPGEPAVLIFGKMSLLVPHWRWFRIQLDVIADAFKLAEQFAEQAETAVITAPSPARSGAGEPAGFVAPAAILTGASAALDIASKLGSYFQTHYSLAGNTVTGGDDAALALCVAGLIPGAAYPACWTPPGTPSDITRLIAPVSAMRSTAMTRQARLKAGSQQWAEAGAAELEPAQKRRCKDLCAGYDRATDAYDVAFKAFDEWVHALAADKEGVPVAALVCDEAFVAERLAAGALALLVRLNQSAGANYTKKNLWSFLGGMPFYVMGSSVASYLLIDGASGTVLAGGQFPIHGGYCQVDEVAAEFRPGTKERLPWYFRLAE